MRGLAPLAVAAWMVFGMGMGAQTGTVSGRGPDAGMTSRVEGVETLPIPGLPFSATDRIVWTRPLEGGGTTTTYLEANVARDSQGRMYRERHRFGVEGASGASTMLESFVYDPVSGTKTSCVYRTRRCAVTSYHPRPQHEIVSVGASDDGLRRRTRENLGTKEIGGLPVMGTRETTTIEPGAVGNDQTLTTSREFWYSAELKTNLAVTRKDPREGTQVIQMTVLSRADPDPAVFAVPAGFAVRDVRRSAATAEGDAGTGVTGAPR